MQGLHDAVEPRNQNELRSFLGMAQYSAWFIQDFTTITEPLRQLTRSWMPWTWGRPQAESFEKVKTVLPEAKAMPYFSPNKPTKILVDASPVGIAGILTQDDKQSLTVAEHSVMSKPVTLKQSTEHSPLYGHASTLTSAYVVHPSKS